MKKGLVFLTIVVAFIAMITLSLTFIVNAASPNLITYENQGFESGTIGNWEKFGGEFEMVPTTAAAHSGKYSLMAGARGFDWTSPAIDISKQIKETGAGTYTFAAYVKLINAADEGTTGKTHLVFRYDAKNASAGPQAKLSASDWTLFLGKLEVTEEMVTATKILFAFDQGHPPMYIDDIFVLEGEYTEEDIAVIIDPNATAPPKVEPTIAPTVTILADALKIPGKAGTTDSNPAVTATPTPTSTVGPGGGNTTLLIGLGAAGLVIIGGGAAFAISRKKAASKADSTEPTEPTEE